MLVYEIFNLGESTPITLKDMIKSIEKATGKVARIKQLPMQPGDVDVTYADISKAKRLLGYNPKTKFDDGIVNFFEWYKENN